MRNVFVWCAAALAGVATTGCADEFGAENKLGHDLRVLAIRAESPTLGESESTRLRALVHGASDDAMFRWSWCPVVGDPDAGFICPPVVEASLAPEMLDLGSDPVATFAYPGSEAQFRQTCLELLASASPKGLAPRSCDDRWTVMVQLQVTDGGREVTAIKMLELRLSPTAERNNNPVIDNVRATRSGATPAPLEDGDTLLGAGEYTLSVDVPADSLERLETPPLDARNHADPREDLVLTWFIDRGETDAVRTGTVEGGKGLSEALNNGWKVSALGGAELIIVVRDSRGGVDWIRRQVDVVEGGE